MGGRWVGNALALTGIGWFFATAIFLGVLAGYWLDSITGLSPALTMVGMLLGLAVAMVGGLRMLQQFLRRIGDDSPPKGTT
jgi:F0F1-type ATP synthase assembly protein I